MEETQILKATKHQSCRKPLVSWPGLGIKVIASGTATAVGMPCWTHEGWRKIHWDVSKHDLDREARRAAA